MENTQLGQFSFSTTLSPQDDSRSRFDASEAILARVGKGLARCNSREEQHDQQDGDFGRRGG